jgi:hypothetical protein
MDHQVVKWGPGRLSRNGLLLAITLSGGKSFDSSIVPSISCEGDRTSQTKPAAVKKLPNASRKYLKLLCHRLFPREVDTLCRNSRYFLLQLRTGSGKPALTGLGAVI